MPNYTLIARKGRRRVVIGKAKRITAKALQLPKGLNKKLTNKKGWHYDIEVR